MVPLILCSCLIKRHVVLLLTMVVKLECIETSLECLSLFPVMIFTCETKLVGLVYCNQISVLAKIYTAALTRESRVNVDLSIHLILVQLYSCL